MKTLSVAEKRRPSKKPEHDPVRLLPVTGIHPSPENDTIYGSIDLNAPEMIELGASVNKFGVLDALVVTKDGYIISGHRRHGGAILAGLVEIPCRVLPFNRTDDPDRFIRLLREHNRNREKTRDQLIRETLIDIDPNEAHLRLQESRKASARVAVPAMVVRNRGRKRCRISAAKKPLLDAVLSILGSLRDHWPLSDRQIHYALLNSPPLIHASKPQSTYTNSKKSYRAVIDILTRARLDGSVPWEAIGDETRPVVIWDVHRSITPYVRREMNEFCSHYARDLMQSQPNHIEIIGEKNTVGSILRPVASEFTIPMTTGRGYCSLDPRHKMAERFQQSGKEKLVLLLVSDFDPDGEEIAESFAGSMRDDFGIKSIHPIKVALTAEQVRQHHLPPIMKAKETSAHHAKFVEQYGDDVFELESLPSAELQKIVRRTIESVLDVDAFNAEIDAERTDAQHLEATRRQMLRVFPDLLPEQESDGMRATD